MISDKWHGTSKRIRENHRHLDRRRKRNHSPELNRERGGLDDEG